MGKMPRLVVQDFGRSAAQCGFAVGGWQWRLGQKGPRDEWEDRLARACVFVSLLLAPPPQGFSSPCCFLSPSSISGGILLLPQCATLSVGPHRAGVPSRGRPVLQMRVLMRTQCRMVGRGSCTPKRCHTIPQHSCQETLLFRQNYTSIRVLRPVWTTVSHGSTLLFNFVAPGTASAHHFPAVDRRTCQWWCVGPMGDYMQQLLAWWAQPQVVVGFGLWEAFAACHSVAAANGHRAEGRLVAGCWASSSAQYLLAVALSWQGWHSVRARTVLAACVAYVGGGLLYSCKEARTCWSLASRVAWLPLLSVLWWNFGWGSWAAGGSSEKRPCTVSAVCGSGPSWPQCPAWCKE
jgi:hypothetical protein